jgi:hypothetical protein
LNNTVVINAGGEERLRIDNLGKMGIGTSIPNNKVEIDHGTAGNSGLRFTRLTNTTSNKFLTTNTNGDVVLQSVPIGTVTFANGTNTSVSGTGVAPTPYIINSRNIYTDNGTLTATRTLTMGNYNLIFSSNSSTSGNGRIYVGNTTLFPAITATSNYRLLVEGGILTEKVKVALRSTANWADYVFADDYKLKPLKEVEAFINENKHLEGVSSANELVKNGLDIVDMQSKQMEKIEELTLYAIEKTKQLLSKVKILKS